MKRQRARVSCSAADVEQRDEAARGAAMSATIGGDRTRVAMAGGGHRRWPRAHGAVPRSGGTVARCQRLPQGAGATGPSGTTQGRRRKRRGRGGRRKRRSGRSHRGGRPRALAPPCSRRVSGGRGENDGRRRSLWNDEKLKPSIYLCAWILREAEAGWGKVEKASKRAIWAIERVIGRPRLFWATWRVAQAEELAIFLAFKFFPRTYQPR